MHVRRLHRHQRAEALGRLDDELRHQPGVGLRIVGDHQHAFAAGCFAAARRFLQLAAPSGRARLRARRAGGEGLQGKHADQATRARCMADAGGGWSDRPTRGGAGRLSPSPDGGYAFHSP